MAWVPLAESEIEYDFQPTDNAQLVGSVISHEPGGSAGWSLQLFQAATLRVTAQSFTGHDGAATDRFLWGGSGEQFNTAPDPTAEWLPSPFTAADIPAEDGLVFSPGNAETEPEFAFLIEVEVPDPVVEVCDEIGRVSRVPVSAHNRTRVASVRLFPGERRCLVANFNGAIAPGRTIVRADWQAEGTWSVSLADAAIIAVGRQAKAMLSAHSCGETTIQVTVTLDNGEVYNQLFVAEVYYQPFEPASLPVGSASLSVTA